MTGTDETLMLAFAKGDANAFEVVYERHRSWLLRSLRGRLAAAGLSGDSWADDVAQETWLSVIKTSADYQPTARFTTWLYHLAQQRMIDLLRRSARERQQTTPLDTEPENATEEPMADLSFDPVDRVMQQDLRQRLVAALDNLPCEQSEVFILVSEAGMTVPEAAQALHLPLESVKSRLRYARAKLTRLLEDCRS